MNDVREVIAEAIPCNIVYGRPQAADDIMRALTSAGFRILGPDEIDGTTVDKCAIRAKECFNDPQAEADPEYVSIAIRALKEKRT